MYAHVYIKSRTLIINLPCLPISRTKEHTSRVLSSEHSRTNKGKLALLLHIKSYLGQNDRKSNIHSVVGIAD